MGVNDAQDGREPGSKASRDGDFSARLKRLGTELERRRPAASDRPARVESDSSLGRAFRLSTEFVAGVIVGGGLGWLFDRALGTKPWGMIVFLLLGFGAGIYNVMRASGFTSGGTGGPTRGS